VDRARLLFRLSYLLGVKPWDSGIPPPELVEVIEGLKALPPGRALDIGCGTGTNCKYMLDHKWDVTGVDFAPKAIRAAKQKAPGARLRVGDVTKLREQGVSGPFDLMLDLGCFHAIPQARRDAYVQEVAHVAAHGATLLMFAFGEKGNGAPGAPEAEIRQRFSEAFDVIEVRPGNPFRKQTWYWMVRKPRAGTDADVGRSDQEPTIRIVHRSEARPGWMRYAYGRVK
jgi:SAM-dependent methyltransferase